MRAHAVTHAYIKGAQDPITDDNDGRQPTHIPLNPHLVPSLLLRRAHNLSQQLRS
jgi:hypothetical protein